MKKLHFIFVFLFLEILSSTSAQTAFRVEVFGKGDPILLFPGFACPGDIWKEATSELSKKYECHVFTFAGFGGVPAIGRPWLAKIKEQILMYVHRQKLQHPVIIGHSPGGTLGLWLASAEPGLFKVDVSHISQLLSDGFSEALL